MIALSNPVTIRELTENIRRTNEKLIRTEQRISWPEGSAVLQQREVYGCYTMSGFKVRFGGWETFRVATEQDLIDMTSGRIKCDEKTDPRAAAWAQHVRTGGD